MNVKEAYDLWSSQYDSNINKTRDLEGVALRSVLNDIAFHRCLEIGCGTGKNTSWLGERSQSLTAVDFSEAMLERARQKITLSNVTFVQGDITVPWTFRSTTYDLVTFSLVLEHVQDLYPVIAEASASLVSGGYLYIGELHPFKQYAGTRARFETPEGHQVVPCFNHHFSDFYNAAKNSGLVLSAFAEYFDADQQSIPRIFTMLLSKI